MKYGNDNDICNLDYFLSQISELNIGDLFDPDITVQNNGKVRWFIVMFV